MSDKPFDGQIIVVTGGGTGIGRATALAFADLGAASVIITGRRADRLAEVSALHDAVVPVVADVASDKGAHDVAEAVRSHGGQLDVLVQNAGIFRASPLEAFDVKSARDVLETNVVGPVLLTARLLPLLRSPGASIVLVSSVGGHKPAPGSSVYAASKAALDSFTISWAKELAPKGIRVNAVAPAAVRTEVYAANGLSQPEIEGFFAYQTSVTPLGRTGEVEDVAPWIVRFAEPASSWVTGQVLSLDGGLDLL